MTDRDLIGVTMQEAQRLGTQPVGPNPFRVEPAIETLREVLDRKQGPNTVIARPGPPMAGLDLDKAIHLRWTLRDIKGKRTKLSPVSPDDLRTLLDLGLIEMQDDAPVLTSEGHRAIEPRG
jgi:hypothetical protein